jgi:hypothetical protein
MASHLYVRHCNRGGNNMHGCLFGILSADLLLKQSNRGGDFQLPSCLSSALLNLLDHG